MHGVQNEWFLWDSREYVNTQLTKKSSYMRQIYDGDDDDDTSTNVWESER